ncbi:MAG: hypothetical protein EP319_16160 [Deltaproteobacteria bacterium]|nr:MAG: hypothetical protein EP319_16160 [Deltaproteobacteria bacterium]
MKKLVLLLTLLLASESYAKLFTVTCTSSCNAAVNAAFQKLENDVNADLPDADQSTYLAGMADASVASQKGVGVDYINDIDVFVVGLGLGLGAHVGNNTFSDLVGGDIDGEQLRGIGIAPSLMLGINLGMFDLPEWEYFDPNKIKLMVNFFTYKKNDTDFNAKMTNFGIHARYKLVEDKAILPAKLVHWHGVNIVTGFEYNSLELAYNKSDSETVTEGAVTATMTGTLTVGAKVNTMSIPVEVSTGATLGYVFGFYGGLGADINFGSAESIVAANLNINATGGATGNGALDLGQKDGPSTILPRAFVGFQLGLPIWKPLTVQLDKGFGEEVYSITAATRVTW